MTLMAAMLMPRGLRRERLRTSNCWQQLPQLSALPELMCNPLNGIFPLRKDAPSFAIDRNSCCLERRGCKKFLENQPTLVRECEKPAHQFEKPRLLPDIQQFEKFRDGEASQSREEPFALVN